MAAYVMECNEEVDLQEGGGTFQMNKKQVNSDIMHRGKRVKTALPNSSEYIIDADSTFWQDFAYR